MGGPRRRGLLTLAAGLAALVAAPLLWWGLHADPAGQTVDTVGASAAAALTTATSPSAGSAPDVSSPAHYTGPGTTTPPESSTGVTSQDVPATAGAEPESVGAEGPAAPPAPADPGTDAPAQALGVPQRIVIPTLTVDASIVPVGVTDDGELEIPHDVSTVGWYRFGPMPGAEAGSAVLTGHVDDVSQGPGVFQRIGDLAPGDTFQIVDDGGRAATFEVVAREQWNKADVPLDRLFDRGGQGRVVLITCGGTFDPDVLGYDDNIAVTAVPKA